MGDFLRIFFNSFSFAEPTGLFMWLISILVVYNIFLSIKKQYVKAAEINRISLILGWMGVLFSIILVTDACAGQAIPPDKTPQYALGGLAVSLNPLFLYLLGWLITSVINFFSKEKK